LKDLRCPFGTTIITGTYKCSMSLEVIRRGGSEIACQDISSCHHCVLVAERLKEKILPELGFENDLLQVPHSMLQRIQLGGLAGLQKFFEKNTNSPIDNINLLIEKTVANDTEQCPVPYQKFSEDVRKIKLRKRHK